MSEQPANPAALYLDANPIIYAPDGEQQVAQSIQALLQHLRTTSVRIVTSELTLAEVLSKKDLSPDRRRDYLELLVFSRLIELRQVDRNILYDAARIRQVANHKLIDAIHVATAVATDCGFIMSNDGAFKAMPLGMHQIKPNAQGIADFLERIS